MSGLSFAPSPAAVADIARQILGEPSSTERGGTVLRFGSKGALKVDCRDAVWRDFSSGEGGGLVDLVARQLSTSRLAAWQWLAAGGAAVTRRDDDARAEALAAVRADEAKRIRQAAAIWKASRPLAGTLAEAYLAARGVVGVEHGGQLRFAPNQRAGKWRGPTMVARISSAATGRGQGIHLTPVAADGPPLKADGKAFPKIVRGVAVGGVIALAPPDADGRLGVSEGIETSLSASRLWNWPVISALCSSGLGALPLIDDIHRLGVFADDDAPGRAGAEKAADRWRDAGRLVDVFTAPDGGDWNDVIMRRAKT
jgi:hypothetical protein